MNIAQVNGKIKSNLMEETQMAKKCNDLDAFKFDQTVETIDTTKKIRVGIIGTGWIAGTHVKNYLEMPDVEIVGGADLIEGKAEEFFASYGLNDVKCFRSHKELIDAGICDAVSICTYNSTHAECTIYALEHGVHVLLEKPMCVTLMRRWTFARRKRIPARFSPSDFSLASIQI